MKTKMLSTLAGLAMTLFLTAGGPAGTQTTQAQGLVEYALILKLTQVTIVGGATDLGGEVSETFSDVGGGGSGSGGWSCLMPYTWVVKTLAECSNTAPPLR